MRSMLLLPLFLLVACGSVASENEQPGVSGTGSGGARSYAIDGFTGVEVAGPDMARVSVGDAFSVRAEGDAAVLDRLRIEKRGDMLHIGRLDDMGVRLGSRPPARLFITMPRVAAGSVTGSGALTIDKVEGAGFDGAVTGSGDLTVAAMRTRSAELSVTGSGDLIATGTADRLSASVTGSGGIASPGLRATGASVSIMGSGGVRAEVNGAASVSIMGSGDADLGPRARCTVSKMGSGAARCGG